MEAPARVAVVRPARPNRHRRSKLRVFSPSRFAAIVSLAQLAWCAALVLLAPVPVAHSADVPTVATGPAPDWVVEIGVPDTAGVSSELLHDGVADLLTDSQVRVGAGPQTNFNRYVSQVVEPSGVSAVGRIQIEFAATYQSLTLHWIRLVRDGVVQERLDPEKIRVLQQEEDIDLNLYYQSATALVLLDDVRVGDRVDYAFSIEGANPIFEGRYQDWHYLEWWYPFGRIHTRIIAPSDRPLYVAPHNTRDGFIVSQHEGLTEYVWTGDAVAALVHEDGMPPGYDPLAALQVSEFETWGQVARWAAQTFDTGLVDDAQVLGLARRLRDENATDAERIVAALRFVQDEVRYLGLEIGVNAYRPHSPAVALERRFGDCKDKSSLLVALLREMGITAHVALVHTELAGQVARLQPTASAFDHAIVRVRLNGETYWVDPTASYERGPLEDEEWFEYGFALVVDPAGETLTPVEPSKANFVPARVVHRYETTDYEGPSLLDVTSTYRGDRADGFRTWSASMARDAIERQYQNYYAREQKGVELAGPIEIEDDQMGNVIVVHERYTVPDLWQWDEELERFVSTFIARELRDELSSPDTVQRTHPLAFSHPVETLLDIEIETPEPMAIDSVDDRVVGPAFALDYEVEKRDDGVSISYHYRSTADRIEPGHVGNHLEAVDEMWSATDYWIGSSSERGQDAAAGAAGGLRSALWREPWRTFFLVSIVMGLLYGVVPRLLLAIGVRSIRRGHLKQAIKQFARGRQLAPPWTAPYPRNALLLSVALGVAGRGDEARGIAASLTRMPTGRTRHDAVATAAWAWRAVLLRDTEPGRAVACADQGVALGATLPGDDTWPVRACALAVRALLRGQAGDTDGALRDLKEARMLSGNVEDRAGGWTSALPLINRIECVEIELMNDAEDDERVAAAGRAVVVGFTERWPTDHPIVLETRLWHAEQLARRGHTAEAWRELDLVRALLPAAVDPESPLHARAVRLGERLESL